MNQSKNYEWYFITIYPTSRNLGILDLEKILFEALYSIRNISEYGFCSISLRSNNQKLKHPHIHILIKTRKNINYRLFLSNLVRKIDKPVSARIYIVDNYKSVKRYIDEHEEKYIYTPEHILIHERENAKKEYLYPRRYLECSRSRCREKTKVKEPAIARIFDKRAKIGWI